MGCKGVYITRTCYHDGNVLALHVFELTRIYGRAKFDFSVAFVVFPGPVPVYQFKFFDFSGFEGCFSLKLSVLL